MKATHILQLVLAIFVPITWSLPTSSLTSNIRSTALSVRESVGLERRQAQIAGKSSALPQRLINIQLTTLAVIAIADAVVDLVKQIELSTGDYEAQFVKTTIDNFIAQNPDWNILVYHDQDSTGELPTSRQHEHYELPVYLLFSYGYEIYVWPQGESGWSVQVTNSMCHN